MKLATRRALREIAVFIAVMATAFGGTLALIHSIHPL